MTQEKGAIIRNLRLNFLKQGLTIARWSKNYHFDEKAVAKIFHRYAEKQQVPQSPFVYKVLTALEKDTGINLMEDNNGKAFKN